jgi:hypothetical protein
MVLTLLNTLSFRWRGIFHLRVSRRQGRQRGTFFSAVHTAGLGLLDHFCRNKWLHGERLSVARPFQAFGWSPMTDSTSLNSLAGDIFHVLARREFSRARQPDFALHLPEQTVLASVR